MLQYNKTLYSAIYEEIHSIEDEISYYKEMILITQKDINWYHKHFPYIPENIKIHEHLLTRKQRYQKYLNNALNSVSELKKRILTG